MGKKEKKSLVGWTSKEFFILNQDFNCYGEHYTKEIFDKRDTFLENSGRREDAIKVRITIEEI